MPADDPPMAQCVARAPGGPTHVLLDDRIAEHVPGCNMAFRRDALLAIGGFNPIYLRAGDDVDVCWRLQARGWKIGFAPSALVWHHHRAVGQGLLAAAGRLRRRRDAGSMAHHPEKFLDGHMLWRGRIYSPLPFVRSLSGRAHQRRRLGHGGVPVGLPHRRPPVRVPAALGQVAGRSRSCSRWPARSSPRSASIEWAAALLLGAGLVGIAATIAKNVAYCAPVGGRLAARQQALVPGDGRLPALHPAARAHAAARSAACCRRRKWRCRPPNAQTSRGPRPSLGEAWRALLLVSGSVTEDRFWSETWTSTDRVLAQLTDWLRQSRAVAHDRHRRRLVATIATSAILVGRWAWLDVRALVEEHGGGKSLLRVSTHLRPTSFGVVSALALAAALLGAAGDRPGAALAAGRRGGRGCWRSRSIGVRRLAHRAGDRDPAARRRRRSPSVAA